MSKSHFFVQMMICWLLLVSLTQDSRASLLIGHFISSYTIADKGVNFGGFSAIELTPDGQKMVALSDRAAIWITALQRDPSGQIIGVESKKLLFPELLGPAYEGLLSNSEGLALAPDGSYYIAFEGVARLEHYDPNFNALGVLPRPDEFYHFAPNRSLEVLAVDEKNRLYTTLEMPTPTSYGAIFVGNRMVFGDDMFPVWRFEAGEWTQPFFWYPIDSAIPVGADFGPDGRLYILERAFMVPGGFESRVRSFRVSDEGLSDARLEMHSSPGFFDNLEGISVWRDAAQKIRFTMISDDNFLRNFQQTQLVEFYAKDDLPHN